jgi:hypothetical protein
MPPEGGGVALEGNDGEVAGGGHGRRLGRVLLGHPAVALEEHALLHEHHGRLHVAEDARGAAQLHALGGEHVAHDLAADEDHAGVDGGVDDAFLADDERVVGGDLALELAVQHDGAAEGVLALDLRRLVDEGAEIAVAGGGCLAAVLLAEHGRTPALGPPG